MAKGTLIRESPWHRPVFPLDTGDNCHSEGIGYIMAIVPVKRGKMAYLDVLHRRSRFATIRIVTGSQLKGAQTMKCTL